MMSPDLLLTHKSQRDDLLRRIVVALESDQRFVAAWLTGSMERGDSDAASDLDLTVVVHQEHSAQLCARPEMKTPCPPAERTDLFRQFGAIGLAYENNYNAPNGGTATNVVYAPSGVIVDWTLVPEGVARRPVASQLLFARHEISPVAEAEPASREDRIESASEMVGFFWLMAAVTAKYLIRGDEVFVIKWLEELAGLVLAVECRIAGKVDPYRRGSITSLKATRREQLEQLRAVCDEVEKLSQQVRALGGEVWPEARATVDVWLRMAEQVLASGQLAG